MSGLESMSVDPSPCDARVIDATTQQQRHVSILDLSSNHVLRAGQVVLLPGENVGRHTTGKHEELVIVQEGEGHIELPGKDRQRIRPGHYAYFPPHTDHDVINMSTGILRYVYVVAPTPWGSNPKQ